MNMKVGDFVCMHNTGIPEWWVEVIGIVRSEDTDPYFIAQYWSNKDNEWQTFHLAPTTAHRGMIKEVRRLEPVIADIFRRTIMEK